MKEFDKWYEKEIGPINFPCTKEFYNARKKTWKAAMEQVLLWGSDDDILFNKIKDEIYGV